MGYILNQNQSTRPLMFLLVNSSDHITPLTGATPVVKISKNGGAFTTPVGAVSEIGNGWYQVAGNASDSNTLGPLLIHVDAAGADPTDDAYQVVAYDPNNSVDLGLSGLGGNSGTADTSKSKPIVPV